MNTEQAALEFIVGLSAKGIDTSVTKLVGAFAKVASAAEFANRAILGQTGGPGGGGGGGGGTPGGGGGGGGPGAAEKLVKTVNAQVSALTFLKGHLVGLGVNVGVKVWNTMLSGVRMSLDMYKEHTKELIKFRKVVGMSSEEMKVFSGNILTATSLYGANIATVRAVATEMRMGLIRSDEAAVALAGRLAQLESVSGISTKTTVEMTKQWVNYGKIMTDAEVEKHARDIKELAIQVKGNAGAVLGLVTANREACLTWGYGKEVQKKMVFDMEKLALSFEAAGGNADDLRGIVGSLGDENSAWRQQVIAANGNLGDAVKKVMEIGQATDKTSGSRQRFLKDYNLSSTTFDVMLASRKTLADMERKFAEVQSKTMEQLRTLEEGRMSDWEKIGMHLNTAKAEATGLWEQINNTFGITHKLVTLTDRLAASIGGGIEISRRDEGATTVRDIEREDAARFMGAGSLTRAAGRGIDWWSNLFTGKEVFGTSRRLADLAIQRIETRRADEATATRIMKAENDRRLGVDASAKTAAVPSYGISGPAIPAGIETSGSRNRSVESRLEAIHTELKQLNESNSDMRNIEKKKAVVPGAPGVAAGIPESSMKRK